MPNNNASLVAFLCCFSGFSYAETQWVDTHALLNQQHLWHEVEHELHKQARVLSTSINADKATTGLSYQRIKTTGSTKRFEHYQVFYRNIPVIGARFVLVKDDTDKIVQGLGVTLRAQEVTSATDGRYFHMSLTDIEQRLAEGTGITSGTKLKHLNRAYLTWQGRLIGVFQVIATSKEGIRTLTIDADTLSVLKSEQGVVHVSSDEQDVEQLSIDEQYVAAGGIGGNEKMGAICYSPQPSTMEACLRYQYDETTGASTELLFNDISDTDRPLIFAEFDGYPFIVRKEGGRCFLENPYVQTIDYYSHHTNSFMYSCDGYYEYFNGADVDTDYYNFFSYSSLNDAHFYGGLTMQFFHRQLNELFPNQASDCSIDGYCLQTLRQRVRNNTLGMNQAYWDGTHVNYGTGYYGYSHYSLTTSSVVAYEAAYALTHWNSQLNSQGEAGAFSQAFADIASLAVLDYLQHGVSGSFSTSEPFLTQTLDSTGRPQADKKWWLGWDVRVQDVGERYFSLPSLDGSSIDHLSAYRANMSRYDVGGLFRKAFYELVKTYGWTVEEAFKLFLNANISCLPANASLDDAATCLMLVANSSNVGMLAEDARKNVDGALHLVGLVAQTSEISSLPVTAMPQYDEFRYWIDILPISEIEHIAVDWGDGATERWERKAGHAIYPFLHRVHNIAPDQLVRFKLKVVKSNGEELLAYRDYYSHPLGVVCSPMIGNEKTELLDIVTINQQSLSLKPQSYQEILDQPLNMYLEQENSIELGPRSVGQKVTVLIDTNHNGAYEEQEVYIEEWAKGNERIVLNLPDGALPGQMMMRVSVGDSYRHIYSCGGIDEGQIFDIKVDFSNAGEWSPTNFSFETDGSNKVKFLNSFVQSKTQPSDDFELPVLANDSAYFSGSSDIPYHPSFQTCFELVSQQSSQRYTYSELSNLFACQTKKATPQTYNVLHPT
ncbi:MULTISPECIES: M4 family metallopeptidase [unclassified Pseudoalteromonas]|uniref:M4 family metallopeptidase n=1 Tax=unclassified Pseudoalteromonas TaxID=194690 RepID=UPI0020974618|nr:M4 family metallopeptidase [Pseudoalteromonas sp. XMcav2-N]MCO7190620.1 M4 family metallopeptidase [Pseudoalteromonas sp. XMcav2-N]